MRGITSGRRPRSPPDRAGDGRQRAKFHNAGRCVASDAAAADWSHHMPAALISLVSTVALAAAPPPATTAHTHRCTPAEPSFTSLVATAEVRCREARALNAYMTNH